MAEDLIESTGTTVTHDETAGLQNSVVTPGVPGDANDDDVAVIDLPSEFSTRLTTLGFDPNDAIGAAESDGNVITINGAGISDLALTDANGDPLDGDSSGLFTTEGAEVFLYTDPVNNNIVLGKTAGVDGVKDNADDVIVFAVYLEETGTPVSGAKFWTLQYESLSHNDPANPDDPDRVDLTNKLFVTADQALVFNFDQLASGANLFGVVGNTTTALVVIGEDITLDGAGKYIPNQTDDIKTSQGGDGATIGVDSQMFDPGEGAYFTYVTGTDVLGVGDNANSITYDGTQEVTGAAFRISQTQGNALATAEISAYDLDDAPQGVAFVNARGTGDTVSITAVRVFDAAGELIEEETDGSAPSVDDPTVDIVFSDGPDGARIATVSGLDDLYTIAWDTSAVHDQVLIKGVAGKFDIGRFALTQAESDTDEVGSKVIFEDDGPVNNAATVNVDVDEDELTGLSTGITDNDATTTVAAFTGAQIAGLVDAGADEPVKVSLNPLIDGVDTGLDSQGANILFDYVDATHVNGVADGRTVFTLVQTAEGDGVLGTADDAFTFTLSDQIDHTPLATGGGDAETIALSLASVFVATDFDNSGTTGDSVVIDAGASVTIENDVPVNNAATVNVNVDEDELTGLSTGITDNDATTTVAAFTGAQIAGLVDAGADEPVTVSLNPAIDGADTGLDSKGSNILFDVVSATQVNGVADGRTVFTLVQTAGTDTILGTADDAFTFTLLDQVDHVPLATGGGDAETIALSLASVFVATDFDGDSVVIDAGASVTIENDVPVNNAATVNVNVDEDELTGLSTGITDNDATTTVAAFTGAQIAGLVDAGADEPVTVSLNPAIDGADTGLDSKGSNILFDVVSATQVNGVADGRTVFTLVQTAGTDTILGTADDAFTFTLLDQVDHVPLATGGGDAETIALSLASVFVATDFDGDSVVIDAGASVTIENDVPVNNAATVNVNVDEDELTGLSTGITDNDATTTVASFTGAQIAGLVDAGADEPVTVSLNPAIDGVDTGLDSKGANILFDVVSATHVNGVADGRTVFTLVQTAGTDTILGTADDAFTFTLLDQVDHMPLATGGGDAETIALSLASVFVATDFDGDSVVIDAGASVTIENDVPVNNAATVNVNVDEDELTGLSTGITDNDATTTVAAFTGAQIAGLVDAGADEPVTVSLNPAIDGADTGLDSKGSNILFDVVSATQVNGVADGRTVFTLVQTAGTDTILGTADDAFTFTLLDQVDHVPLATGGGDAETIALSLASVFVATDFDGDSVVINAGATVTIENDVPTIGPISDGLVDFTTISGANSGDFGGTSTSSVTNSLNGAVGADEPATYTITSSPTTVTIFDGTSAELTLLRDISGNGTVVTYFEDVDGSGTRNAGDTDFFQLTLSGGNYTFAVLEDPPPATLDFNFDQLASGANLFGVVGSTSIALVVIGEDITLDGAGKYIPNQTDDIKTSQGGDGATIGVDSQMFDPGEGAYFTYVTDTGIIGGGDNANSIDYGDTFEVNTAAFRISQTQGNDLATAEISAYDLDDAPQEVAFVNARGTGDTVSITAVRVFDAAGELIEEETDGSAPSVNDPTVDIVFSDGPDGARIATVSGLDDLFKIEWDTSAEHDQVLIKGVAGKFDIGEFSISQAQPTPDELLDFTAQIVDFDGDTASADFSVGIDGTGDFDNDIVNLLGQP